MHGLPTGSAVVRSQDETHLTDGHHCLGVERLNPERRPLGSGPLRDPSLARVGAVDDLATVARNPDVARTDGRHVVELVAGQDHR